MTERKLTAYLAGPINDCTDEDCKDWRERMKTEMPEVNFLDPMRRDYRDFETEETAIEIVENDKKDIDDSDVILVYHDRPSVGTSMEVLYAFERDMFVLTIACTGKPLSPWILYHSTKIVKSLEEAIEVLKPIAEEFTGWVEMEEDDL